MKIIAQFIFWPGKTTEIDTDESYKLYLNFPQHYCVKYTDGFIQASNISINKWDNPWEVIPNILKAKLINFKSNFLSFLQKKIEYLEKI